MGRPDREERRPDPLPLQEVVPARAVLTELARGFLLVQNSDPVHAARFARSFLKEQAGPTVLPRAPPAEHLTSVGRGVATALRERRPE
ncbi:MAG TPA: hypothetical protein VMH90_02275 [Thermoplasmata archaeon]|nr:hypothetical protein [Thermoplasmata archaeon]